jgi:hypothetical protein
MSYDDPGEEWTGWLGNFILWIIAVLAVVALCMVAGWI